MASDRNHKRTRSIVARTSMVRVSYVRNPRQYGADVRELLVETDDEFVPPLSSREGPTQTHSLDESVNDDIEDYHERCMEQEFVVAVADGTVVGFLSFRTGYEIDALDGFVPSNYVSTIVVHPDHRREGLARRMYHTILTDVPEEVGDPYVTTRTWSENDGHRTLLEELGFETVTTIPNDRGEGIHTVYYGIPVAEFSAD